ncbi:MAG TPA: GNAT family N-acetyltransferase [Gaiellaceae bacterium]|nr:GNAT family N-acetyltransferase [Gaiellaceae bacterium]
MSAYTVRVARTPEEVDAMRGAWAELRVDNPASDPDHLLTFVRHSPVAVRPHVTLLERDGRPDALAVGWVGEVRLGARLGYATVYRPRLDVLTIAQGGLVVAGPEQAEPLLAALLDALRNESLDLARVRAHVGSPAHQLATTRPGALVRGHGTEPFLRVRARLPETFADYLKQRSGKTRSNLQRYSRRLEERFGDGLSLRLFESPDDLPRLVEDTRAVYEKTYQRGLGAGFSDDEPARSLRRLAAERGWLKAWVLYLDGAPAAFWHGTLYRRIFYTGPTGYDPEHRNLRVGTFVLGRMIEQLCGKADEVDFGLGDAEYKRHFGDESWAEEDVLLFARRPRPVVVNLARTGVVVASQAAKAVLERTGGLASARRMWRDRLAERGRR